MVIIEKKIFEQDISKCRNLKYIFCAIMFCLIFSYCMISSAYAAQTYKIYDEKDLLDFADAVTRDNSVNAVLMDDIDMSGVSWQPIAAERLKFEGYKGYKSGGYNGTFDGGGYTIYNLYYNCAEPAPEVNGLYGSICNVDGMFFSDIGANGVVKNLNFKNINIEKPYQKSTVSVASYYRDSLGIIAGKVYGKISNCTVQGEMLCNEAHLIGGIATEAMGGSIIENCVADVDIERILSEDGMYAYTNVGGIVADTDLSSTTINDCINKGNIKVRGYCHPCGTKVAGIAAFVSYDSTIKNCVNEGNIDVDLYCTDNFDLPVYFGGIASGDFMGRDYVVNCYNKGNINSKLRNIASEFIGGVFGYKSSYRVGYDGEVNVYNCFSTGRINNAESNYVYYNNSSEEFTRSDLINGTMLNKFNNYVENNPQMGCYAWIQSDYGIELGDENTKITYSQKNNPSEIAIYIDGEKLYSDQSAIISNSRTMVPFRAVSEALGCNVEWINETKTVKVSKLGLNASLRINDNNAYIDSGSYTKNYALDSPPIIYNSRTMIPIRFMAELFGYNVDWDANSREVYIYT